MTALIDESVVTAAFKGELAEMENRAIKGATIAILRHAHPRFFTGPSNTSSHYHPKDEFFAGPGGDPSGARPNEVNSPYGGQVLHVRRVAVFVRLLCEADGFYGSERELALAGALCHDMAQYEEGNIHTVPLHEGRVRPLVGAVLADDLLGYYAERIVQLCEAHSGRWGYRLPTNALEKLVATADFLASRRNVGEFNPNIVDWRVKAK